MHQGLCNSRLPDVIASSCLVEESNDLACDMLSSCLLMVHNASACRQDNVAELSTWQQLHHPFFQISQLNVVAWRDDTSLVEAAIELDDYFTVPMIIHFFEFANVT
jgi:hypothetical protein